MVGLQGYIMGKQEDGQVGGTLVRGALNARLRDVVFYPKGLGVTEVEGPGTHIRELCKYFGEIATTSVFTNCPGANASQTICGRRTIFLKISNLSQTNTFVKYKEKMNY